ncbi:MAG: AMP-binding protein [Gammaproteobacteria bacterium]|nr:AMP-binding protein [Gammaproteobacteria bacterium]
MAELDTFPKLLIDRAKRYADRQASREKEFGIWQSWTWAQVAGEVEQFACGLRAMGFERGDKLAIIGDNRPRLYWSVAAVQSLGGVPVPTYQDAVAEEMQYVLEHAGVRFVLAENQEQVDKVLEVADRCPQLEQIIYDDTRGLRDYDHTRLTSFVTVQEKGRELLAQSPQIWHEEIARGKGSDDGIILYTSGTTGNPKGVVLTHENMIITAVNSIEFEGLREDEETLAYMPMAWVGDHIFSYAQAYVAGFCVSCPENTDTVMTDLREIGPTYFFAPPAIFERLLTNVMIRIEDAAKLKQKLFHYFMGVAKRIGTRILDGEKVSFADRLLYGLGDLLVYAPLKNTLGLSRVRLAYTAGEAIGPEIFDFYRSLGINIKQLLGQTEASVFITIQRDGEVRSDTVGPPAPGVEVRIEDSGEVMYRSPGVFKEYYKNPAATAETKTPDGWVHTGDAGFFDDEGHLRVIDRAKDVGKLTNGAMFAPKFIENKLKFFPHIKEAVAFGHERDHTTVFINIDLEAVGNWAERHGIPYGSYQELAARPEVYEMVHDSIEQVNRDLAADSHLASSQIKRFLILHKQLDPDDGELTRTMKVRRRIIADRYGELIEALYSDRDQCHIDTEVTFEDGRKGTISADLRIRDTQTFQQSAAAH